MEQVQVQVQREQMINEGWRAAIRLMNGQTGAGLVWQVVNAADCLAHPETFSDNLEFPAIPAKKAQFIQRVVRSFEDDPAAPERALP